MSAHDALDTDTATLREGLRGAEAEHAEARAATSPRGASHVYAPPRVRDVRADAVQSVSEGNLPERAVSRDGTYRRLLALADLLAASVAFAVTIPFVGDDTVGLWTVLAVLMVVPVCKLAGLYDRDEHLLHKRTLDEAPALFFVASLYTLLAFLAGDAIVEGTLGREQAAVLWGLLFLAMLFGRICARYLAARLTEEERCVILGNAQAAHWLSSKLARSEGARVKVVGRVPLSSDDASVNELQVLGSFDSLASLLVEHEIDRALIAPGWEDSHLRLLDVVRVVKRLGVRTSVLPRMFEVVGSAYEVDEVEGATLLGVRRHGLTRSSWMIKRSFDLLGASLLLFLLAPLMALISLVIKLDSRGPIFFRQRRVGREDQVFEIFKFRTMADGAHAQREALAHRNEAGGGLFKIENDPRITRVGRLLRRTSLDELPQLFNVLGADMSLVGPRPLVVDEDRLIQGHQRHRLLVPPGVTGLWQIFGSARIPLNEMVKIDYLYGANWSLWMDIKILLRTVLVAAGRRGL